MTLVPSGIGESIVLFSPTVGITAVAGLMLALFVLAMVFLAVAPLVSTSWADELSATSTSSGGTAAPSDD
ncbi:hypothetical protein [Natronorubrum halophilum]|uniref:hypothetical protein n=1 Tax=Natronorubrum halophilum TaxID=1702106 RepID=UPI000EF6FC9B|nr:hypothetical protein [Natronorubrum halophilum]